MEQIPKEYTEVHQLDEIDFKEHATYTFLSARRSGKTFLIRELVYILLKRRMIDQIYLFSHTAKLDPAYDWIAPEFIFSPDVMDQTIDLIFKIQANSKKKLNVLIIVDDWDVTSTSESINKLYTRGRHYNLSCVLSAQITTKGISPSIRNNSQYVFVRSLNAITIKRDLFNMLLRTDFEDGNTFYHFVKENNSNYTFILYLNDDRPTNESICLVKGNEVTFTYDYKKPKAKDNL